MAPALKLKLIDEINSKLHHLNEDQLLIILRLIEDCGTQVKTCPTCGKEKSIFNFSRRSDGGPYFQCKKCERMSKAKKRNDKSL